MAKKDQNIINYKKFYVNNLNKKINLDITNNDISIIIENGTNKQTYQANLDHALIKAENELQKMMLEHQKMINEVEIEFNKSFYNNKIIKNKEYLYNNKINQKKIIDAYSKKLNNNKEIFFEEDFFKSEINQDNFLVNFFHKKIFKKLEFLFETFTKKFLLFFVKEKLANKNQIKPEKPLILAGIDLTQFKKELAVFKQLEYPEFSEQFKELSTKIETTIEKIKNKKILDGAEGDILMFIKTVSINDIKKSLLLYDELKQNNNSVLLKEARSEIKEQVKLVIDELTEFDNNDVKLKEKLAQIRLKTKSLVQKTKN